MLINRLLKHSSIKFVLRYNFTDSLTSFQKVTSFKLRKPPRELKAYEKLFYSIPIMSINIEAIIAINELRPKATYIVALRNAQNPGLIMNSTYNIVECLNFSQAPRYYFKSFSPLIENMAQILTQKIDWLLTGMHKQGAIKRTVFALSHIDSAYGERLVELTCVYFIWILESSIQTKNKLIDTITAQKAKIQQINARLKQINEASIETSSYAEQRKSLLQDKAQILQEIKLAIYNLKYVKQQDFLCGLHHCLQRGYYSEAILKQFFENILQKNDKFLLSFDQMLKEEKQFFPQLPLSNFQNRKSLIYCRMYSCIVYRIKILNELKKLKKQDTAFMQGIKKANNVQNQSSSQSNSQDSQGLAKIQSESSQQTSEQKKFSDNLIEQSLISKQRYLGLVNQYLQLLERKDILNFLLTDQSVSQVLRVLPTQFYTYVDPISFRQIKKKYISIFKEIYNIEKNGSIYAQSSSVQSLFEIVLRMYDFDDRKQVFQLLKLYEKFLLTRNILNIKTLAPFYLFEKYQYKSNFIASKFFQYINKKYRIGGYQNYSKEQIVFTGNQICKNLSLYFKLLQNNISTLYSAFDLKSLITKRVFQKNQQFQINRQKDIKSRYLNAKYQQQFQQAVQIFLHNYNKIVSLLYVEQPNSSFIGRGSKLYADFLKSKYFYDRGNEYDDKNQQQDIKKILKAHKQTIQSFRTSIHNVYEKQFTTQDNSKQNQTKYSLSFDPASETMFLKKNFIFNPLDQIISILEIMQTAIQLLTLKNVQFSQDILIVFKSIFQNKQVRQALINNIAFPEILKKLVKLSELYSSISKKDSNRFFQSILKVTDFNLSNFLYSSRISYAREILNIQKQIELSQNFQPLLNSLQHNKIYQKNPFIWQGSQSIYTMNNKNVSSNVRSDILYTAFNQNYDMEKVIKAQLAIIKTVKPTQEIKNMKVKLNYLQYPYIANAAINRNNQLIIILVRKSRVQDPSDRVLLNYYQECQQYFRKKGNKVIIVSNEQQIKNSLANLVK